jgi:hypothetical protein
MLQLTWYTVQYCPCGHALHRTEDEIIEDGGFNQLRWTQSSSRPVSAQFAAMFTIIPRTTLTTILLRATTKLSVTRMFTKITTRNGTIC